MRVQHNISAINANRNLNGNNSAVSKSLEKLSSGYRINRAGDDAAGLAISEKMRAQISCLTQAETNCNDGVSLIQTAEGALTEVHSMLNRMTELAEQSANGTYDDSTDRKNLQDEVDQLKSEIDRISKSTNFNGIKLLDGSLGGYKIDYGATKPTNLESIKMSGGQMNLDDSINIAVATDGAHTLKSLAFKYVDEDGKEKAGTLATQTALEDAGFRIDTTKSIAADGTITSTSTLTWSAKNVRTSSGTYATEAGQLLAKQYGEALNGLTITTQNATGKAVAATAYKFGVDTTGDGNADTLGNGLTLQIGDTSDTFNKLSVNVAAMDCKGLSIEGVSVATQDNASDAVKTIKDAINTVSSQRGALGAMQNRLEHTINNLSVTNENITNAESRIRDTDMAKEMMTYTSKNILAQAAQSMLAQANQQPQQVLSLLQ